MEQPHIVSPFSTCTSGLRRRMTAALVGSLAWFALALMPQAALADVAAATPTWASDVPFTLPNPDELPSALHEGGVEHLLLDRQWRVTDRGHIAFTHDAKRLLSLDGIEAISTIAVPFHPEFETAKVHRLVIHRDGEIVYQTASALGNTRIEPAEGAAPSTLRIQLDDVRVGDVVEYSYSVESENPVYAGRFSETLAFQFEVPVANVFYRLLWPNVRSLGMRQHNTDISPSCVQHKAVKDCTWTAVNTVPVTIEEDAPGWYDPYPSVTVGDELSWAGVAGAFEPVFRTDSASGEQLAALIEQIRKTAATPLDQASAAVTYVQQQIANDEQPLAPLPVSPLTPNEILDKGVASRRDKAVLAVALLRSLDIEAYPAMVHTERGKTLPDALPALQVFDDVIVTILLEGKQYWVDPKRLHQSQRIDTLYQPELNYALTLTPTTTQLTAMDESGPVYDHVEVIERIDLSHTGQPSADLAIETHYDYYYAEDTRAELDEKGVPQLAEEYRQYTSNAFGGADATQDLSIEDDARLNRVKLVEHYRLPDVWQSESGLHEVPITPFTILDNTDDVSPETLRTMPFSLVHPVEVKHTVRVKLPDGWQFESQRDTVDDAAFTFSREITQVGNELLVEYRYKSLAEHVEPQRFAEFAGHSTTLRELADYTLRDPTATVYSSLGPQLEIQLWGEAAISILALIGFIL